MRFSPCLCRSNRLHTTPLKGIDEPLRQKGAFLNERIRELRNSYAASLSCRDSVEIS